MMTIKKRISIVTSCYNEEENILELHARVKAVMDKFPQYEYEYIFADNASTDRTAEILRLLAQNNTNVKVVFNSRNFGPHRSGYNIFRQATGDCVININADMQEPPEVIKEFLQKWEEGYKIVIGVKKTTKEKFIMRFIRRQYYKIIRNISDLELVDNFMGFGLYDRVAHDEMKKYEWPVPYFIGMVAEIGFDRAVVYYDQAPRKHGVSSFSFLKLFDVAMMGITSVSKVPLRVATLLGIVLSFISLIIAIIYFIMKLTNWQGMSTGIAPLVIGIFFFASVQILFIGLLGEYVLRILEHVDRKTLVVEKEHLGFDDNK